MRAATLKRRRRPTTKSTATNNDCFVGGGAAYSPSKVTKIAALLGCATTLSRAKFLTSSDLPWLQSRSVLDSPRNIAGDQCRETPAPPAASLARQRFLPVFCTGGSEYP